MVGTTNIELIELAKCLSIPNFNCVCKDEINGGLLNSPLTVLLKHSPTIIIVNLNDSDKNVNGH